MTSATRIPLLVGTGLTATTIDGYGTSASPHYWVWVPAGATPPPPPPPRR
jgi:hypothetical protein